MKREHFEYLCQTAEAGQDALIRHADSHERGLVTSCVMPTGHMLVRTPQGERRCWDFNECEELRESKSDPML